MQNNQSLPLLTLVLMISFASINAVMFTPALPNIAHFFDISAGVAQQTVSVFLVGFAIGQLLYGPLANRYGRKPALYIGVGLQIVSSFLCVIAGLIHHYQLLVIARLIMALGSSVGLIMTFTMINECYEPKIASSKLSQVMIPYAVAPGLSIALGGVLNTYFGWMSCFYVGAIYGILLLFFVTKLPETLKQKNPYALEVSHLLTSYGTQFTNISLITGGVLMGAVTAFIYVFAALAPFLAMDLLHMNSSVYGAANILPPIGLMLGSLLSARLVQKKSMKFVMQLGISVVVVGVLCMFITTFYHISAIWMLFAPMTLIYFGLALILPNASVLAMKTVSDKAHGASVMSFLNMGLATLVVLSLGYFTTKLILLPLVFLGLTVVIVLSFLRLKRD